jgi:hypothetical protein
MLAADRARIVDTFDDATQDRFVASERQSTTAWRLADTHRVGPVTD